MSASPTCRRSRGRPGASCSSKWHRSPSSKPLISSRTKAALAAAAHPRARLLLVPRSIRRARAHEAASREFTARGLARTRGRTGILIYLAVAEGHAEIVADSGIASRISPAAWSSAIDALLSSLRRGAAADGLVSAVEGIGAVLAQHLPRRAGDIDELPNRVIVTD